jgi:hypothetical protein
MKNRGEDQLDRANKMLMNIIIILMLVVPCAGQEPIFDHPGAGGPGPIPLIDTQKAVSAIGSFFCPDCEAEELAVNDTHYFFLNCEWQNGSWVLNNTTVG